MAEPTSWAGEAVAKYGPTALGLVVGTLAKYGLTLSEGRRPTWTSVVADLLLLGMLGLIAIAISDAGARVVGLEVSSDVRVLIGSLAAVSSDRLVRLVRDRFLQKVESELDATVKASPATIAEVPAGGADQPAASVRVTVLRGEEPRTAPIERLGEKLMAPPAPELGALLDRIHD